jgi:hypothetical protein
MMLNLMSSTYVLLDALCDCQILLHLMLSTYASLDEVSVTGNEEDEEDSQIRK